jgi:small subunit ribosomal protein S2
MVLHDPSKKERLQVDRLRAKLEKNLFISDMSRLPAALFVVDIKAEHIAIKEAQKLNIPVLQWLIPTLILVK